MYLGLVCFILIALSCSNKINKKNNIFKINYIKIELPFDYNIQRWDTTQETEYIITRNRCILMVLDVNEGIGYYQDHTKTLSEYTLLIDTIDGFRREIGYNKKNLTLGLEIGKIIKTIHHHLTSTDSELAWRYDTNTISGKLKYYEEKQDQKWLKEKEKEEDSLQNYKIIMTATSNYEPFTIKIKDDEIDTLIKYFKKIEILKKFD